MIKKISILLLLSNLIGCSTNSIKEDFKFDSAGSDGIAVFSVSHDNYKNSIGNNLKVIFYMNGKRSNKNYRQLESTEEVFFGGWNKKSEIKKLKGRVFAISLPEGEHALTSWLLSSGGASYPPRKSLEPLKFNIKKGEIKYLGNFHMNFTSLNAFWGLRSVGGGYAEIVNESKRDIPIFENKYPHFKNKIKIDVLKIGIWGKT